MSIASRIDELCQRALASAPDQPTSTVYLLDLLEGPPEPTDLNRVLGEPEGVSDKVWPRRSDDPGRWMEHLFTLDLRTMPELARRHPKTRALALFLNDREDHACHDARSGESALVCIDPSMLPRREASTGRRGGGEPEATGFAVHAVAVPDAVFQRAPGRDARRELDRGLIQEIRARLLDSPARVLGEPLWLHEDAHPGGRFILQFDDNFVPMELGDCGVMYVFEDTVLVQGH